MLNDLFKQKILTTPWPVYIGGEFFNGTKVAISNSCNDQCISGIKSKGVHKCLHGLSHVSKVIDGTNFIVTGVYLDSVSGSQKLNKRFKLQKASVNVINDWFLEIEIKFSSIKKISNDIAKNKFDQFHEFAKWANEINFYANRLVDRAKNGQCSGFEAATEDLKSLYKTSVMLIDSLDTSSIYFNPESASFGHKRPTDIYSMIHKISLVLSHSKINKGRIQIQISGRVKNKHRIYESFKIIPLSFLQNALKYRKANDVEVLFEENGCRLIMSVISYGDLIPTDEIPKLFERGFRASSALQSNLEGNGLGLYVADIVAKAHDFNLSVKSEILENKGLAKNSFSISIF